MDSILKRFNQTGSTGLLGFFVDHFPEENGQNSSPSAKCLVPYS
jgi:hypothetical protein